MQTMIRALVLACLAVPSLAAEIAEQVFPDGSRYVGQTRAGYFHGQGVFTRPGDSGFRYEGGFRHGQAHGQGVLTKPEGTRIEGWWHDGELVR